MSNAAINPAPMIGAAANHPPDAGHGGRAHDPHLAHHFDTPEQQYSTAKLGMWVFLGTELLMFGGLFCGYAVYRHNHPDVFEFAHHFLDKWLGAANTLVLITSSLTMAWAVRSSQLGSQTSLRWLLGLTILGGYMFLGVKSVEYHTKWQHHLFIGSTNKYRTPDSIKGAIKEEKEEAAEGAPTYTSAHGGDRKPGMMIEDSGIPKGKTAGPNMVKPAPAGTVASAKTPAPEVLPAGTVALADNVSLMPPDPNAGAADQAKIRPPFVDPAGLAPKEVEAHQAELNLETLGSFEQQRLYTFFGIYFFMTGLHGLHVVIGMSLIAWVLLRSVGPRNIPWAVPLIPGSIGLFLSVVGIIVASNFLLILGLIIAILSVVWAVIWMPMRRNAAGEGEFGPTYFTPVDLVGLYWHLVDLIWIFLFPLLYLIH
ncbi:MAG TPA: hypothetical protein VG326_02900 [Tepidisphaeraceae bacterium]|jgi:cytochrome c oxidase subunit 3|nr:hypothetical protein [Tepidisphaeraceae bacterium]